MKRSVIYLSIVTIVTLLLGWGLYRVYRVFKTSMAPTRCVYLLSPLSSEQANMSFKDLFGKAIIEKGGSFVSTVQVIQQNFPHCTSISCRQQPSGVVHAQIEIDEPFCAVNDDMLLTANGTLVSKSLYSDDVVANLPQLRVENTQAVLTQISSSNTELSDTRSSVSPHLLSFLRTIPESFFSTHEVVYRSDDEIFLTQRVVPQEEAFLQKRSQQATSLSQISERSGSKSSIQKQIEPKPMYLCAVNTVINNDLLARCETVMADLEQQKIMNKKKARTAWVLDVRFDKQVVLYPHMGGLVHG